MNPFKAAVISCAYVTFRRRQKKKRKTRRFWIHPLIESRLQCGQFHTLHQKLKENPEKFFEYYRMSVNSFKTLLSYVKNGISGQNTGLRDCITAEEKLSITLRYLATGNSIRSLHFEFLIGRSTISKIIRETCTVIWDTMQKVYMKDLTEQDWLDISVQFEKKANFPHCIGSIDGKHIRLINPWGSGSEYFNYKKYFSIVLMAVADTNYCFRYIDVGAYGHEGDSNILKSTDFGRKLYSKNLLLPEPAQLPNDTSGQLQPYVFVADEAFALCENLLRPYPSKNLTTNKRIFNYRLSRARRYVECAFGILANKWRIFHRPIDVSIDLVDIIVKATCVLHNFVREEDGYSFEDTLTCPLESIPARGTRGNVKGKTIRDQFADYFCSEGAVSWQNKYAGIAE